MSYQGFRSSVILSSIFWQFNVKFTIIINFSEHYQGFRPLWPTLTNHWTNRGQMLDKFVHFLSYLSFMHKVPSPLLPQGFSPCSQLTQISICPILSTASLLLSQGFGHFVQYLSSHHYIGKFSHIYSFVKCYLQNQAQTLLQLVFY